MNKKWMVLGLLLLGSTLQAGANLPYPPLPPLYTSEEYEKITSSSSTKSPAPIQSTDDSADLPYPPFPNQEEGSNEDASSNKRKRTPSPVTTSPQILPAEIITTQNQQSASSSAIPQLKTKFECPYCEKGQKTFPDNPELTNHIKNNHTGEWTHICPYQTCNKAFPYNIHLTTHIRTHTGENPYLCEICNRSFTDKSNLTKHTSSKKHIAKVAAALALAQGDNNE